MGISSRKLARTLAIASLSWGTLLAAANLLLLKNDAFAISAEMQVAEKKLFKAELDYYRFLWGNSKASPKALKSKYNLTIRPALQAREALDHREHSRVIPTLFEEVRKKSEALRATSRSTSPTKSPVQNISAPAPTGPTGSGTTAPRNR